MQVQLMTGAASAPLAVMRAAGERRSRRALGRTAVGWRAGRLGSRTMGWFLDTAAVMAVVGLVRRRSAYPG